MAIGMVIIILILVLRCCCWPLCARSGWCCGCCLTLCCSSRTRLKQRATNQAQEWLTTMKNNFRFVGSRDNNSEVESELFFDIESGGDRRHQGHNSPIRESPQISKASKHRSKEYSVVPRSLKALFQHRRHPSSRDDFDVMMKHRSLHNQRYQNNSLHTHATNTAMGRANRRDDRRFSLSYCVPGMSHPSHALGNTSRDRKLTNREKDAKYEQCPTTSPPPPRRLTTMQMHPDKSAQSTSRRAMGECSGSRANWQCLTPNEREFYEKYPTRKQLSGKRLKIGHRTVSRLAGLESRGNGTGIISPSRELKRQHARQVNQYSSPGVY